MAFDTTKFQTTWITNGIDSDCIDYAEAMGEHLCSLENGRPGRNALTNSQIRNFFGEVKRIQQMIGTDEKKWQENQSDFQLLRPKLAYAESRVVKSNRNSTIKDFRTVIEAAHRAVEKDKLNHFKNFVDFMEAVLAYHKASGGKD